MRYRDYLIKRAAESKSMWSTAKDYGQKGLDFAKDWGSAGLGFAQTPAGITTGTGAAIGAFLGWRNAVKNKRTGFRKALSILLGAGGGGSLAYGGYKAYDHLSGNAAKRKADKAEYEAKRQHEREILNAKHRVQGSIARATADSRNEGLAKARMSAIEQRSDRVAKGRKSTEDMTDAAVNKYKEDAINKPRVRAAKAKADADATKTKRIMADNMAKARAAAAKAKSEEELQKAEEKRLFDERQRASNAYATSEQKKQEDEYNKFMQSQTLAMQQQYSNLDAQAAIAAGEFQGMPGLNKQLEESELRGQLSNISAAFRKPMEDNLVSLLDFHKYVIPKDDYDNFKSNIRSGKYANEQELNKAIEVAVQQRKDRTDTVMNERRATEKKNREKRLAEQIAQDQAMKKFYTLVTDTMNDMTATSPVPDRFDNIVLNLKTKGGELTTTVGALKAATNHNGTPMFSARDIYSMLGHGGAQIPQGDSSSFKRSIVPGMHSRNLIGDLPDGVTVEGISGYDDSALFPQSKDSIKTWSLQ